MYNMTRKKDRVIAIYNKLLLQLVKISFSVKTSDYTEVEPNHCPSTVMACRHKLLPVNLWLLSRQQRNSVCLPR